MRIRANGLVIFVTGGFLLVRAISAEGGSSVATTDSADFPNWEVAIATAHFVRLGDSPGWQNRESHRRLLTATAEEKTNLQRSILVMEGFGISFGLRAYAMISDPEFASQYRCQQAPYLAKKVHTGAFAWPRSIRFPRGLISLSNTYLVNPFLFNPLREPYTLLLGSNYGSADAGNADLAFSPGKVLYIRLSPDEEGYPRGFILLIYGDSEEAILHPWTFPRARQAAERMLGGIPRGVVYLDAVLPEWVAALESQPHLSFRDIYEAMGIPYSRIWDQRIVLRYEHKQNNNVEIVYPDTGISVSLQTGRDPDERCFPEPFTDPYETRPMVGPDISILSRAAVLTLASRETSTQQFYVDWGDGSVETVVSGKPTEHFYAFGGQKYILQIVSEQQGTPLKQIVLTVISAVPFECPHTTEERFETKVFDYSQFALPEGVRSALMGVRRGILRQKPLMDLWEAVAFGFELPPVPGSDLWEQPFPDRN
jgi:hypothetical protein